MLLEAREGSTLTVVDKSIFLLGGVNQKMVQDVSKFDITNMEWQKFDISMATDAFPRFNHTCVAYKHNLYIFGGEKIDGSFFHTRVCLNDIKVLDLRK